MGGRSGARSSFTFDGLRNRRSHQRQNLPDKIAEVDPAGDESALARICQHLPRKEGGAFAGLDDLPQIRTRRLSGSGIRQTRGWRCPRIPVRRLLKSCAMPPASRPRLSSFWVSCSSRSNFFRS